jgi:hypothetical protein
MFSIAEAADSFLASEFDLILLDDSLSIRNKDRLTSLIRASDHSPPSSQLRRYAAMTIPSQM